MAEESRFSDSIVNKQASNPAIPGGLAQTAQAAGVAAKTPEGARFSDSIVGQYAIDNGYTGAARSWYTGANMEGVSNSWDTGFQQEAYSQFAEQQDKAMEARDSSIFYDWFDRDDATGVVTWEDTARGLKKGDVFSDGKKVANLYDDFDDKTANVMLAEFTLDGKTKQKIFADPDRDRWLADEIDKVVAGNTEILTSSAAQKAFADSVDTRQEGLVEGIGDELITAAGAAGGAAITGGAGGAVAGPWGAVAGVVGGALGGGLSAFLNSDQLTEQTARALEVSSLANKKYGEMAAFTTGVQEFSGVGLRAINPVSNLVQGSFDAAEGKVGDGEAEFYAVDDDGNRKASSWWRGADLAGVLADSVLQFSNPVGVGLYLTGTTGHITGNVGSLFATGGDKWDDRSAGFHDIEGAGQWAAAAGSVGIDAVQIGFGAAIAKAGVASRAAFATETHVPGRLGSALQSAKEKLAPWRNPDVVERKTINGMRFGLDDAGKAITARPTMTLLAPSEAMRYVPTAWRARNRAAMSSGAAGPDDYYRAALEMGGGNRVGAALVNGWAEGSEEAVQAVLEPISVDADVKASEVVEAYLYGMATGAGMSLGAVSAPATDDQAMKYRAQMLHQMRNQGASLTDEQWSAMSRDEKKRLAIADPAESQQIADAMKAMAAVQAVDKTRTSAIGVMALNDLKASAYARDLANANPNRDGTTVLAGFSGDHVYAPDGQIDSDLHGANTAVASMWQTLTTITDSHVALETIDKDLARRLEAATEADEIAELTAEREQNEAVAEMGSALRKQLMGYYEQYRQATTVADAELAIDQFNAFILDAHQGRLLDEAGALLAPEMAEAAKRAVEVTFTRHPNIDTGSFVLLVPQASKALSRANAHGQTQVHQSILKALGGDHDGDTLATMNFTSIPAAQREGLRAGGQYLAQVEGEQVELVMDAPDGEKHFLSLLGEAFALPVVSPRRGAAERAIHALATDLHARYDGRLPADGLLQAIEDFKTAVRDGDSGARMALANTLFNLDTQAMLKTGLANGVAEAPWLMQRISRQWEQFQQDYAANDPGLDFTPKDVENPLPPEMAYQKSLAIQEAATDGQTMSVLTEGADPVREAQKLHYSIYRALTSALQGDLLPQQMQDLIELYAQLGSNVSQSEQDRVGDRNSVQRRVAGWLQDIADVAKQTLGEDASQALMLLANTQVRDIRILAPGQYEIADGDVSLLQVLLKRSIEIERQTKRTTIESDEDLQRKLARLERISQRSAEDGSRSTTAQQAMVEVFGSHQLHDLLGDSSKYLGPQLTLNQLIASLGNKTEETRRDAIYRWKRKAPYVLHSSVTANPPYSVGEVTSGALSSYKIVVDAIAAVANKVEPRRRTDQDRRASKQFKAGIDQLQQLLGTFRRTNDLASTEDIDVLRAMLEQNASLASTIAGLIPDAAKLGAFRVIDGRAYAAPWVEEMLVATPERAEVMYFVNTRLAEWNQLGGDVRTDDRAEVREDGETPKHPRRYAQVKSRFLQTMYHLAVQPDGVELDRLVLAMKSAPSLDALMEQVNNEAAWRGDRAPLLGHVDDVAEFDADPADVWSANLPGTLQREAIAAFADKTRALSTTMAKIETELATERTMLSAMRDFRDTGVDRGTAKADLASLELAIANRVLVPDHIGPRARDRFTAKIQSGMLRMHDKGKADPDVAPFGEHLVVVDEFGVKQAVFQTADALTSFDPEDILANPTKLAEGPVRVGLADGSSFVLDMSTTDGALAALSDPQTNAFAKQVLFPTARDLNGIDVLQSYQDVTSQSLRTMLHEADFRDLFVATDKKPSVSQALKMIGMLEAAVRKDAVGKDEAARAEAYFPIQNAINEYVVAYTHRAGSQTVNQEKMRGELYVDIASALTGLTALHMQDPALVTEVADVLKATLRARHAKDSSALRSALSSRVTQAAEDVMAVDAYANLYSRQAALLQAQIGDPATDAATRAELQQRLDDLNTFITEKIARLDALKDTDVVQAAVNMFTLTGTESVDLERKSMILRMLGTQNRVERFQGNYRLIDKVNFHLSQNQFRVTAQDTTISTDEWSELGLYASTVYLAEMSGRAGSNVDLTKMVLGEESSHRFFDYSWSYLVDNLVNPLVLDKLAVMARQAKWEPRLTKDVVAGQIETSLLNEKKLGKHTEMIVTKSVQAKRVLASASVGLAIPVGGDLPKEAAAYVAAGRYSYKKPIAAPTTRAVQVVDGEVAWSTEDIFKLNNHFAASVTFDGVELLPQVGKAWMGEATVENSPFKILSLQKLNEELAKDFKTGTMEITYFDVDDKPFGPEWANNVYYVGVGRERDLNFAPSLMAEQVFGVGGVSKKAQQNPLDMATKGGAGYQATPIPALATALQYEAAGSVAEVLREKALHMAAKEYDWGTPLPGDALSLYQLMKFRHLVVGTNAEGEKVHWWAEQAIEWQQANQNFSLSSPDFPLANAQLVTLTDSQAQTLLGEPGNKGLPGVITPPVLNLDDISTFPDLSAERLASLGLTRLGEQGSLRDSPFAGVLPLGEIYWSGDKDHPSSTRFEAAIRQHRADQLEVRHLRTREDRKGSATFDISRINEANARALDKLLGVEALAPLFARYNIPFAEMRDMGELSLTQGLAKRLEALREVNPSAVIWQHAQGMSANPAEGVLTELSLKGDFDKPAAQRPTYEDIVIVDLELFERQAGGNLELALSQAKGILRQYSRIGATVVLAHSSGGSTLRSDLADWMNEGALGYESMAESAHFFAPIAQDWTMNQTWRSLNSTLSAVRQMTGRSVILTHNADRYGDASSENTTFQDLRPEQPMWRAEALTLLPTQIGNTYGVPVKGKGPLDQMSGVRDRVLEMLKSPEGRAHLKSLGGDPAGVPVYRVVDNGLGPVEEPGIRGIDAAMDRLQSLLESNTYPLTVGEELMMGDLIPVLGLDDTILFVRAGFQLPNVDQLAAQLATPIDKTDPAKNPGKVAIAVNDLQAAWTVRPPAIIESLDPDQLAGASAVVKYDMSRLGKSVSEGDGWKTVRSPMPNDLAGPPEAMGTNGLRVNSFSSRKAPESKQSVEGQVRNFGWAFALSGISFEQDMVEFFLGAKTRTPEEQAADWDTVNTYLTRLSRMEHGLTESQIADLLDDGSLMAVMEHQINAAGVDVFGAGYQVPGTRDPFVRTKDPIQRLGQVMIAALMAPRVKVEHVIGTRGLLNLDDLTSGAQVTLMPPIFTDALNSFDYPELREMLFDRINASLPRRQDGTRPYVLAPDWTFHQEMTNPQTGTTEMVPGNLQISLEYAADENAVNYTQSRARSTRQDASQHVAFTISETFGGRTSTERTADNVAKLFSDEGIERFDDPDGGGFWQMLRAVPLSGADKTFKPWKKMMPLQRLHMMESHAKVVSYLEPLDQSEYSSAQKAEYAALQDQILDAWGLDEAYRVEIDYLVRQFFGVPASRPEEPDHVGKVSAPVAKQAAALILDNVRAFRQPVAGGVLPIPHETLMRIVKEAGKWAPRTGDKKRSPLAKGWDEWVSTIFGQAKESEALFDSMFRKDLDGFAHTYIGSTEGTADMPLSMDTMVDLKLADQEANTYLASLDPYEEALLTEPVIFDTMRATLDAITGHDPVVGAGAARGTPSSELAKRIDKHVQWHATKKMPKQEKRSFRSYTEEGAWYLESSRDTHSFFHNVVNISVGMRLLNPALWVSAVLEVYVRNQLEGMTNLATGRSSTALGRGLARAGTSMGMDLVHTPERQRKLIKLSESMGADNRFLSVVYDQLMYQNMVEAGRGRFGRGTEKFAKFAATATSDPTFGMLAKSVAMRYNEAALEYIETTDSSIPFDAFVAQMNRNPLWLMENFDSSQLNPHKAGLNRIAHVRSMKATTTSKLLMGGIDALTTNPKWSYNAAGHLLKIPFLFTRFNANALTTMTGLGGLDQMVAMFTDQRSSRFVGRTKAFMSGRQYDESMDIIDMSDILDGVNLIRPFTQGAITHTGLMAAGMMAGGLGLSGEDEETKRRRRLAEFLGTPYYYDPRRVENDFRYADAGWLDWLPGLSSLYEVAPDGEGGARSAAMPHWIVRQFLSPVIGMERFFSTGDTRHIKWGFQDAFAVIPNSVTRLWHEASVTGDVMLEAAKAEEGKATPESSANATQLLINTVGMYERALLENSFVNAVRNGMDKYNRDPWTPPRINENTGVIKRDPLTGAPLPSDALESYVDEDGQAGVGYTSRGTTDAKLHQYAENNLGAALMLSLFTGQVGMDSTYFRNNMPPAQVSVTKKDPTQAEAEATFIAALSGMAANGQGLENLTLYEVEKTLKAQAQANGEWWDQGDITARAQQILAKEGANNTGGMSVLDKAGNEVLTQAGADSVLRSLAGGTIDLGSPAMQGVFIPVPMRKKIEEEWTTELVMDGIKLGLDEATAQSRARRLWYGNTFEDPNATGLRAILWDDRIPWTGKVTYNQLNTTFVMGPDGKPWATNFPRQNLLQAMGIPLPHRALQSEGGGLSRDIRGNVVDDVHGINTGLMALERVEDQGRLAPPEDEPKAFSKPVADLEKSDGGGGSGWTPWKRYGSGYTPYKRRSYGSGGGYSSNGYANFTRMYQLPEGESPYGNNTPFINTSNPILRRGDVRRERVWSERGRLNQWQ